MKKKVYFCVLIIISLIVAWQVFSIYYHKGNLAFSICNESGKNSPIEIFIDGEKITTLENSTGIYSYHSKFVSPKSHILVIKFSGNISREIKINTVLFTLIYVGLQCDNSEGNLDIVIRFRISKSKCPLLFLS